jgi:hypothetical protein
LLDFFSTHDPAKAGLTPEFLGSFSLEEYLEDDSIRAAKWDDDDGGLGVEEFLIRTYGEGLSPVSSGSSGSSGSSPDTAGLESAEKSAEQFAEQSTHSHSHHPVAQHGTGCGWEVYVANDEMPGLTCQRVRVTGAGWDWGLRCTWGVDGNRGGGDEPPPRFRPQASVVVAPATVAQVAAARREAGANARRLAEVQALVRGGRGAELPAVRVRGTGERVSGLFTAHPTELRCGRPVYRCERTSTSTSRAAGGCRRTGGAELHFDGERCCWASGDSAGDWGFWSVFGADAPTPDRVPAGCWEHDDGHFARWGVDATRMTVEIETGAGA